MPDTLTEAINALQDEFNASRGSLIDDMVKETNRRNSLDGIIDETNRRIKALEQARSTTANRRIIRQLRAKLVNVRASIIQITNNLKSLDRQLTSLRAGLKLKMSSLLKGGAAGLLIEGALVGLEALVEGGIWSYVEENYDKENGRRCIDNAFDSMLECFGKGSWDLDRTKSQLRSNGKLANVHDMIANLFSRIQSFYDFHVQYDSQTTSFKIFARSWIATQVQFFGELEKIVKKGTLERSNAPEDFEYITGDFEVSKCLQKLDGQSYPSLD